MDYAALLLSYGPLAAYVLMFAVVFAESGILVGAILPGDSLLIAIGIAASRGALSLPASLLACIIGAIVGDNVGYAFGKRIGPGLFARPDSRFFKREHLQKAHAFSERYGPRAIVLARFVPFARTFAPILAGISEMPYRIFFLWNVLGGLLWVFSIMLLGYFLGVLAPGADRYMLLIIGVILVLSVAPAAFAAIRGRKGSPR